MKPRPNLGPARLDQDFGTGVFSEENIIAAEECAQARLDRANKLGVEHVRRFYALQHERGRHADGILAEAFIAALLDVPYEPDLSGRKDRGFDVVAPPGRSIQVRSTRVMPGRLMVHVSKGTNADWLVLVRLHFLEEDGRREAEVRFRGGIKGSDFYYSAKLGDFGHGSTRYLEVEDLMPWPEFRDRLTVRA